MRRDKRRNEPTGAANASEIVVVTVQLRLRPGAIGQVRHCDVNYLTVRQATVIEMLYRAGPPAAGGLGTFARQGAVKQLLDTIADAAGLAEPTVSPV